MDYSPPGSSAMGFPRQEYWSGLPFPSPGDLPNPATEPTSPSLQADSLPLSYWEAPWTIAVASRLSSQFLPMSPKPLLCTEVPVSLLKSQVDPYVPLLSSQPSRDGPLSFPSLTGHPPAPSTPSSSFFPASLIWYILPVECKFHEGRGFACL